jgi:RNA polymerase primary sigma factor
MGGGAQTRQPIPQSLTQYEKSQLLQPEVQFALGKKFEISRERFRRSALSSVRILQRVVATFEKVQAGALPLDPTIDAITSLDLTREKILKLIPDHLPMLKRLLRQEDTIFANYLQAGRRNVRFKLRRQRWRLIRKMTKLVAELSPRTQLLEHWCDELNALAGELATLVDRLDASRLKGESAKQSNRLREKLIEIRGTPREIDMLMRVQHLRRGIYQQARRELAKANLPLVVPIAKQYRNRGLPFADLIQEGNSGLMWAINTFDFSAGGEFGVHARFFIHKAIERAIGRNTNKAE